MKDAWRVIMAVIGIWGIIILLFLEAHATRML